MKLYKLENQKLIPCGNKLLTSYGIINNPSELQQKNEGYKELVTNMPELTEIQRAVFVNYVEDDDKIIANYISENLTDEEIEDKYSKKVEELIRKNYSVSDEFALHRKQFAGVSTISEEDAMEFLEYNTFCEQCKLEAKEIYYADKQ